MNVKKLWPMIIIGFLLGFWPGCIMTLCYSLLCLYKEWKTAKHDKAAVNDLETEIRFFEKELENPPEPKKIVLFEDAQAIENQTYNP